jgi:hypothetical protein
VLASLRRFVLLSGRLSPSAWALSVGLLLGLALPLPAHADQLDERAQDVIEALRSGDVSSALGVLGRPGIAAELVGRPALVHVLCDRAYRCDEACREAPNRDRVRLSAELLELAEATYAAAPADARAQWALAHALVLRERTGPAEGPPAWLRAAELLELAHEAHPADGEALGYAITFLLEGAVLEPGEQHALQKKAAALARKARRAHPESVTLAATIGSAHIWTARMLVGPNRRSAKAALQVSFDSLRPFVARDLPITVAAAQWNEAVTLDRISGFALREEYATAASRALDGDIVFDVPVSPAWTVTEVPETEDYGAYVYVTQAAADGTPLRQLLFRRYTWGQRYAFAGPNEVNGDNVKKIAEGLRAVSSERLFAPGARAATVKKTKVGKDFSGRSFEITGRAIGDEGGPLGVVGHCVRGAHQESFGFLVYVYAEEGELGPEMEAVLASLQEFEE